MKLKDCNTTDNLRAYIGNSRSWEKALRASKRKWEGQIGTADSLCGFCFMTFNLSSGHTTCYSCPVQKSCRLEHIGVSYSDKERVLKVLYSPELKTSIDNSKPGQVFTTEEKL